MFDLKQGYRFVEPQSRSAARFLPTKSDSTPTGYSSRITQVSQFLSRWLLLLLLASYALAAFLPASAVWGSEIHFGEYRLLGESHRISLSMVLLAALLFNVGLDIPLARLGNLVRQPGTLLAGLAANMVIPVLYIWALSYLLVGSPNAYAVQGLILGLALIASMPIAGSSAAWAQSARGNMALTLGMILCSTVLSPLTTPLLLQAVGSLALGDFSTGLEALAGSGMSIFLTLFVLTPSTAGLVLRRLVGDRLVGQVKPALKLLNSIILLLLTYLNASTSLPAMVAQPDWLLLELAFVGTLGMCVLAFTVGWVLARLLGAEEGDRTALMFGLGMNNNGTGLVLAATALGHMPEVMLPVICYNLIQHVVAGVVTHLTRQPVPGPLPVNASATKGGPILLSHPAGRPSALAS